VQEKVSGLKFRFMSGFTKRHLRLSRPARKEAGFRCTEFGFLSHYLCKCIVLYFAPFAKTRNAVFLRTDFGSLASYLIIYIHHVPYKSSPHSYLPLPNYPSNYSLHNPHHIIPACIFPLPAFVPGVNNSALNTSTAGTTASASIVQLLPRLLGCARFIAEATWRDLRIEGRIRWGSEGEEEEGLGGEDEERGRNGENVDRLRALECVDWLAVCGGEGEGRRGSGM
jgi:hypothetical protein